MHLNFITVFKQMDPIQVVNTHISGDTARSTEKDKY
jgi:hypothetical protein